MLVLRLFSFTTFLSMSALNCYNFSSIKSKNVFYIAQHTWCPMKTLNYK